MPGPTPAALPTIRTYAQDLKRERARRGLPTSPAPSVTTPPPVTPTPPAAPAKAEPGEHIVVTTPTTPKAPPPPPKPRPAATPLPAAPARAQASTPAAIPPFHTLRTAHQGALAAQPEKTVPTVRVAITNDPGEATIITDTKHNRFNVFTATFASIAAWWKKLQAARQAARAPRYVVPSPTERKAIIQKATAYTGRQVAEDDKDLTEIIRARAERERTTPVPVTPVDPAPSLVPPISTAPTSVTPPPAPIAPIPPVPKPAVTTPAPAPILENTPQAIDEVDLEPTTVQDTPPAQMEPEPKPTPVKTDEAPVRSKTPARLSLIKSALVIGVAATAGAALLITQMTRAPLFAPAPTSEPQPTTVSPLGSTPVLSLLLPNTTAGELISLARESRETATTYPLLLEFHTSQGTLPGPTVLTELNRRTNPNILGQTSAAYLGWVIEDEPFLLLTVFDERSMWGSLLRNESDLPNLLSEFTSLDSVASVSDESLEGRDVRVLRNDQNESVMVYGFLDEQTVVITTSEASFRTLATKYERTP